MARPTWVIMLSATLILIGIFSLFGRISDINIDKLDEMVKNISIETDIDDNDEDKSIHIELSSEKSEIDSLSPEKQDSAIANLEKVFGENGIVLDDNNNIDIEATTKKAIEISDYRKKWTITFGWIGAVFSVLFMIGGLLLFYKSKFTVPFIITLLSTSMAFGFFQFMIFKADVSSGNLIKLGSKFEVLFAIALDVILLIVFMAIDKSYLSEEKYTEDF